jgi:hypothetical protein
MQIGLLLVLLDVLCVVHAAKTGRFWPWGAVILAVPGFGALAYFLLEILPEWLGTPQGQLARHRISKTLDPAKHYRMLSDQLEVTDTIANRVALAEECLELEKFEEALRHYDHVLALPMGDEAVYALGKARNPMRRSPRSTVCECGGRTINRQKDISFTLALSRKTDASKTRFSNIRQLQIIFPVPKRACAMVFSLTKRAGKPRRKLSCPRCWLGTNARPDMYGGCNPSGSHAPKRRFAIG